MPRRIRSEVRNLLSDKGRRFTKERGVVLDALLATDGQHPTAEQVYLAAKGFQSGIGLATVYRTLDLFVKIGIVSKSDLGGESARYELTALVKSPDAVGPQHLHHHLVCVRCGEVTEFNEDLLDELEASIAEKTGFVVIDHSLKVYGHCKECARKLGFKPR